MDLHSNGAELAELDLCFRFQGILAAGRLPIVPWMALLWALQAPFAEVHTSIHTSVVVPSFIAL